MARPYRFFMDSPEQHGAIFDIHDLVTRVAFFNEEVCFTFNFKASDADDWWSSPVELVKSRQGINGRGEWITEQIEFGLDANMIFTAKALTEHLSWCIDEALKSGVKDALIVVDFHLDDPAYHLEGPNAGTTRSVRLGVVKPAERMTYEQIQKLQDQTEEVNN